MVGEKGQTAAKTPFSMLTEASSSSRERGLEFNPVSLCLRTHAPNQNY